MAAKCNWSDCEKDAEYRELVNGKVWQELCEEHHIALNEVPVRWEKIEKETVN